MIWQFGRWPSTHDLDLAIGGLPHLEVVETLLPLGAWQESGGGVEVLSNELAPLELPWLTFALLLGGSAVPLDVFLDYWEPWAEPAGFVPALWVEQGRTVLNWRYCAEDFFSDAVPLTI